MPSFADDIPFDNQVLKIIIYMIMMFIILGGSNIRNFTVKVADEEDFEFVQGLQKLGVKKNVASLITYLKEVDEASSRDIEIATDMRQPEVSIAMRTLREKGWVAEREIKSDGKGRPQKVYSLRTTIGEIINYYEAEKNQETAHTIEAIQKLKKMVAA
jgi:predicted transcriptional regulator